VRAEGYTQFLGSIRPANRVERTMPPIPGLGIDGKVMLPVEAPWKAELLGQLTRGASLSMRLCARVAVSRVSRTAKFFARM
jgi:hypothetical protein